jgi:hypothetical protein
VTDIVCGTYYKKLNYIIIIIIIIIWDNMDLPAGLEVPWPYLHSNGCLTAI